MIRRPPRSTLSSSSAASDVYKRQQQGEHGGLAVPVAPDDADPVALADPDGDRVEDHGGRVLQVQPFAAEQVGHVLSPVRGRRPVSYTHLTLPTKRIV